MLVLSFSTQEEQDKFEYLFYNYQRLLLHKAHQILNDHMLAEDAASEALLRVYKNLHKIEDPDSPQTVAFLVIIVRNVALTMLKREQTATAELRDDAVPEGPGLEAQVLGALSEQEIYALINQLGEELKSVFLLKYAYGLSHQEIGEMLHMTQNNVTVRLHRGKKKLRKLLEEEGYRNGR